MGVHPTTPARQTDQQWKFPDPHRKDILGPWKNCRGISHETLCCTVKECFDCRDQNEAFDHYRAGFAVRDWKKKRDSGEMARQTVRQVVYEAAYADYDDTDYTTTTT